MKSILKVGLLLSLISVALISLGGSGKPVKPGQNRPLTFPDYKNLDVNQLNVIINSDGTFADSRHTNAAGCEWPKGTGKTCIYTAGLWVAGIHRPTHNLRTAVMDYSAEFQPGPLLETFNTTTNVDPPAVARATDSKWHLYKVDKRDLRAGTNPDLLDWPGDAGAPYIDVNGNGVWDPGIDQIKFYGDQQLFTVINDANPSLHGPVGTTPPMGIEVQCLYFGFNQPGALGNIAFLKWKIINKSDADYDSAYVSMWSDIDLGDGNDDLIGCDTNLSLGYVYNGSNVDAGGAAFAYGTPPPADGYDFFEGPKVPGLPTDSAIVDGKWIHGFKNLPMTSFVVYTNGTLPDIVDPPTQQPTFASIAWDYQRGLAGTVHRVLFSPTTGLPMTRWFSGDPTSTPPKGDLPSNFPIALFVPQDIRIMLTSGPFTLAQGDTQEVVCAFLINKGTDYLNSITALKTYDKIAQDAFNSNFVLPSAPPLPDVRVSSLPNKLMFDWTSFSDTTEAYDFKNYKFQAYTFYQGESVNGPWHELATYDLKDTVGLVFDNVQNPVDGNYYLLPSVQFPNSGLKRYFIVDKDVVSGGPLINGKQYYFALTTWAFNVDPNALKNGIPLTLEHSKEAIVAVPRQAGIGTVVPTYTNQILPTSRPGDDAFMPQVVGPTLLTGKTYTANVNGSGTNVTSWDLYRSNAGGGMDTLVRGNTSFTGDDFASPYVDGMIFRLTNPPASVRSDVQTPNGWSYTPPLNRWITTNSVVTMQSGIGASYPTGALGGLFTQSSSGLTKDKIKKIQIRFSNSQNQHAYRYLSKVKAAPTPDKVIDSSFVPWIKNRGPGLPYQGDYATVTVPFTVWEIDSLDGVPAPQQLNVGFVELNDSLYSKTGDYLGLGRIDGVWDPTIAATGGSEPIVVFASAYTDTAQAKYTVKTGKPLNLAAEEPNLDVMYIIWPRALDSTKTFQEGDVLTITPDYPLVAGRQFTVNAPAVMYQDPAKLQKNLADLNVFPNPYFGGNSAEQGAFNHYVTFSHLPQVATIKIFTISGELVRTIQHANNNTADLDYSFERWDLRNTNGLPVASGVYLAHIDVPGAGSRVLKVAIVAPELRPTRI